MALYKTNYMPTPKKDYLTIRNIVERQTHLKGDALDKKTLDAIIDNVLDEIQDPATRSAGYMAYKTVQEDLKGNTPHYFIQDDNLIKFLQTTEIKDFNILKLDTGKIESLIVHTHNNVYTIGLGEDTANFMVLTVYRNDDWINLSPEVKDHWKFAKQKSDGWYETCKFAINLMYYLKAFPDIIKPGFPEDMCKSLRSVVRKYKDNRIIGVAPQIVHSEVSGTKAPHFRQGFFRTYVNDRYVNMKGKVQFIEATMVKGRQAKTVENSNII